MPSIVDRPAQKYVAEFPRIADRLPPLIGTLAAHGLAPAGAPFFRQVQAGKYVLDTYVGAPDGLAAATAAVLAWAAQGVTWDRADGPDGEEWGGRLEVLRSNPLEVPDPTRWVTDLLFRLAG